MGAKTTTTTEYAVFMQKPDGTWRKTHPFWYRSVEEAKLHMDPTQGRVKCPNTKKCKIMRRTVTVTTSEWEEI